MIISAKCTSVSQHGSSIFVELRTEDGDSITIRRDASKRPICDFGAEYALEINNAHEMGQLRRIA